MLTGCRRYVQLLVGAPANGRGPAVLSRSIEARVRGWRCRGCHVPSIALALGIAAAAAAASRHEGVGACSCRALGGSAQITSRRSYA